MRNSRRDIIVQLRPDDFDVTIAALGIAAKQIDKNPMYAQYGGGDNVRRVRKVFFSALEGALEEREAAADDA